MITVGDEKLEWFEGMTVEQVMAAIKDGHQYAVVRIDGKTVSRPHFGKTAVCDHAEILPIPLIAGG
jgi:sulfur carrier protein ThiS